jgi:hypothetical protein
MASTTFVINDSSTGTSNPLVQISIAENGDGTVTFTVTQLVYAGAYLGDLRGLFFDLARENLIGTLSVVGAPAHFTELQQGNDTVKDLGQGANMQGLLGSDGGYDVGIEIGTSGIGKDDVRSFGFTLSSSAGALTLADFAEVDFGVRITSVGQDIDGNGTIDTARTESAKIGETTDPTGGNTDDGDATLTVIGTAQEDSTLTASFGNDDPDGAATAGPAYQWYRDGLAISGATASTYLLGDDDVGATITVVASYTDGEGFAEAVASAPTATVLARDDGDATVTIAGTAQEDVTLAANFGNNDPDGAASGITYQWRRNGIEISGATASTYLLGDDDVGAAITVVASYTDGQGFAETVESAGIGPVVNVDDEATGTLAVSGAAQEGGSLLAALTGVGDTDGATTTAYRWQELIGGIWIDIPGAGTDLLSIPSDQSYVGKEVRAVATTTDVLGGTTEFVGAGQTILNVNDAPTAAPVDLGAIAEDGSRLITAAELLAGVSDVDGPAATITSLTVQTGGGVLTDNLNGTWSYTPAADDDTSVVFFYTASDGEFSASSTASLDLTAINDAPTAVPVDLGAIAEDGSRLITAAELLAGLSDVDGPAAAITALTVQSGSGELTDNLNGTWSYTPAAKRRHVGGVLLYGVGRRVLGDLDRIAGPDFRQRCPDRRPRGPRRDRRGRQSPDHGGGASRRRQRCRRAGGGDHGARDPGRRRRADRQPQRHLELYAGGRRRHVGDVLVHGVRRRIFGELDRVAGSYPCE